MARETLVCAEGVPAERLAALHDEALPASDAERLRAHIAGCAACQARLAEFDAIGGALRGQRELDPGDRILDGVRARIASQRGSARGSRANWNIGGGRRVWAGLAALAPVAALILLFVYVFSGAARQPVPSATPTAANATANATATAAAQPVLIQLMASPSGTIAANSLELRVETTVINQTGRTIRLTSYIATSCLPGPPLVFSLVNRVQKTVWLETHSYSCPLPPAHDVATIAAGGSKQWTTTFDLRCGPEFCSSLLIPGTYTLVADGLLWHEGTISETGETSAPHGYAHAETVVTLP